MRIRKLLYETALILLASVLVGFGSHIPLIKRYFQGEFRYGFISLEKHPSMVYITLPEAEGLFQERSSIFIDSRTEDAYNEGHIVGAVNIPYEKFNELFPDIIFPLEQTFVVYCDGTECKSSTAVAKLLYERGFHNIKIFFGGWTEWIAHDLPVSEGNDTK